MAEAKDQEAHHLVLAKFKDGVPPSEVDQLIKGYANLVNLIPPMKAFHWGTDLSIENLNQGFTHVFDATFESTQGIAEYVHHPAHLEFANIMGPALEKVIVIDYKPSLVHL